MSTTTSSDPTAPPPEDPNEVLQVARGIATAVAPPEGLTEVQAMLLQAIASALTGRGEAKRSRRSLLEPIVAKLKRRKAS